jgi:hypothetical protein
MAKISGGQNVKVVRHNQLGMAFSRPGILSQPQPIRWSNPPMQTLFFDHLTGEVCRESDGKLRALVQRNVFMVGT